MPERAAAAEAKEQKAIKENQHGPRALLGEAHMVFGPKQEDQGVHGNGTVTALAGSIWEKTKCFLFCRGRNSGFRAVGNLLTAG